MGVLQVALRLLSGGCLGEIRLAQTHLRREPDYIELYRTVVHMVLEAQFLGQESPPLFRVAPNGNCYSYDSFRSHYGEDAPRQWVAAALRMVSVSFVGSEVGDISWGLLTVARTSDSTSNCWDFSGGLGGFRSLVIRAHRNRNPFEEEQLCEYIPPLWA